MYELNGTEYSLEQLQSAAQKYNMDFDSYLEKMKTKGLVEKTSDVATQDAPVASEENTASKSETTSSASQPKFSYDPDSFDTSIETPAFSFLENAGDVTPPSGNTFTVVNDRIVEDEDPFPLVTEAQELEKERNNALKEQAKKDFQDFKNLNKDITKVITTEDGFLNAVVDYDQKDQVELMNLTLDSEFLKNNEDIKKVVEQIKTDNYDHLLAKQLEILNSFELQEEILPDGTVMGKLSDEDFKSAVSQYNEYFANMVDENPAIAKIRSVYADAIADQHQKENNAYTVDKYTPNLIKQLQIQGATNPSALNVPYFSIYNSLDQMITGGKSAKNALLSNEIYAPTFKHYNALLAQANKENWTDETEGYVNPDNGFFSTKLGPASGYRNKTTWGEARVFLKGEVDRHQKDYTKSVNEILTERDIQSAYRRASFEDMASGENSFQNLKMMVAEQLPVMISALLSYGTAPAITEGAGVYESLIQQEARKLYPNFDNIEDQNEQARILYEIAMNDDGSLFEKSAASGVIIGQLERVGAKATLFPMLNKTAGSLVRGQYKLYLKNLARGSVSGSFSEALTEGMQTFVSSAVTGEFHSKEFIEAMGMGGTIGFVMPFSGQTLKQTTRELKSIYRMTTSKFDGKSAEIFFDNQIAHLTSLNEKGEIPKAEFDEKIKMIKDLRNNNAKIPRNYTKESKEEVLDVLLEKQRLQEVKEKLDPNLTSEVDFAIEQQNEKLKEIDAREQELKTAQGQDMEVGELRQEQFDQYFEATAEMAEEIKKQTGRDIIIEETDNSIMAEALVTEGIFDSVEEAMPQVDGTESFRHGIIISNPDGSARILLNKESSIAQGKVTTAAHEFLHAVLFQTLKGNTQAQMEFGQNIFDAINEQGGVSNASQFIQRTSLYSPEEGLGEEMATILSESMLNGDVKFNEGLFTRIKDNFRRFMLKYTNREFTFDKPKDFYNFIKDYNASLKDGKLRNKIINVAAKGATGKLVSPVADEDAFDRTFRQEARDIGSGIYQQIEAMKPQITSTDPDVKREGVFMAAMNLENEVDRRLPVIEGMSQEDRADVIRNFLFDERRGLIGLLNNYDPEINDSIMGYLNSRTPGGSLLNSRLQEFYKNDPRFGNIIQSTTDEATGRKVERRLADEATTEVESRIKPAVLAEKLNIQDQVEAEVNDSDVKFATLSNFKSVPNAVRNTVGEMLGISPDKIKSKANLTAAEVASAQRWFNKNASLVIQALPQGFDSEGKATGIPKTILDAFYNKRSSRAKTKAGLKTQVKRTDIKDSELLELVDVIDGTPTRNRNTSARVIALADLLGKIITNQEIRRQNPELTNIADGMSKYMFSKEDVSDSDLDAMLRQENAAWKKIVANVDQVALDIKNSNGDLNAFRNFVRDILAPNFPIEFFTGGTFAGAGKSGRKRNFAFTSIDDLNQVLEGAEFAESDPDITAAVSSVGKYGKLTGKTVEEKLKNLEYHEASRRGAKKIWLKIQEIIQANPETIPYFAAMFASTSQNMNHFARVSSTLEFTNTLGEKNVEEHTLPASDFAKFLFNKALQGNLELYIDGAFENYAQGSLPLSYDKKLKGEVDGVKFNYVTVPPKEYHLDILLGLKSKWIRYFNPLVNKNKGGINPNFLLNAQGQTIAEEFNVGVDKSLHDNSEVVAIQQDLLYKVLDGQITETQARKDLDEYLQAASIIRKTQREKRGKISSKAVSNARAIMSSKDSRGASVFDFDETLIIDGENFVTATKDGETVQIPSDKWPIDGPKYAADGWKFDFSDFVNVRGGKEGPLLQKMKNQIKKYGNKNVFVLTARMQEAAEPIHKWLQSKGIDIPIENITGLGKSEGDAKAQWFIEKYAEGYNDMYFVDDALPNVEAVQHVFDQLDMKGKSVQAKIQFSKDINKELNKMLERNKGVGAEKIFSKVEARKRGKNKGGFTLFVPPSAEDFVGLLRYFVGKGEQGDADIKFFEEVLIKPYARGDRELSSMKQGIRDQYKALRKQLPNVRKKLGKLSPVKGFTFDAAIRVYLFNKAGYEIPGLAKNAQRELIKLVESDPELRAFADGVSAISKRPEGYMQPDENWDVGNIAMDLQNIVDKVSREQFLSEWIQNKDIIFSPENLNKIEAIYGTNFRNALEDMLYRMQTGQNRRRGRTAFENKWNNWINSSVGAIMFFNARSAVLQTLSTVNFINFEDNNIFAAAKAFANQRQYWKDFSFLFNSDFLRNRRAGLATNVNEAELASAVAGAKNKAMAALRYLLKIGFTPTQAADSFAIAAGGATYYRNRVKKYLKEGRSQQEAEDQAMLDFREIAEETQQSARPDRISMQQASNLGRIILAFANTPMQYNRLIKKAAGDLINGRGDWRSNVSRIVYYGAMQNFIFASLQNALFALAFDDSEEDDERKEIKEQRIINSMLDSLLRGSGIAGAVLATVKNALIEYAEQDAKGWKADYGQVIIEALQVSPPLGSKARKLFSASQVRKFNQGLFSRMDLLDYDNPTWEAMGYVVEATTNIPMARAIRKIDNLREAMNQENTDLQRLMLALGWSSWDLGVGEKVVRNEGQKDEYTVTLDTKRMAREEVKQEIAEEKKQATVKKREQRELEKQKEKEALEKENLEKQKEEGEEATCAAITSSGERCKKKPGPSGYCTVHEKVEKRSDGKEVQCSHIKSNKKRCKMRTKNKSGLCYYHD